MLVASRKAPIPPRRTRRSEARIAAMLAKRDAFRYRREFRRLGFKMMGRSPALRCGDYIIDDDMIDGEGRCSVRFRLFTDWPTAYYHAIISTPPLR